LLGTQNPIPQAYGQGKDDAKKIEVSATPDKATVKPGDSQAVDLKLKRGKDANKEVTVTVEVDPKDKGVSGKEVKIAGDKSDGKVTIETTSGATDGDYKVTLKAKSDGSPDATASVLVTVKKGEVAKPAPVGDGELKFLAFDKEKTKRFFQEQNTVTKQKMTVMGQEVVQDQDQTFLIEWTPKDKSAGNYVVEQQIRGVDMTITIGGNKIKYDSRLGDDKQPKNPMTDFFGQLKNNKLEFTITPALKIEKIDHRDKFIKDLGAINPQMNTLLQAILSEDALKKMAEPAWYAFPEGGKIPGSKTWDKQSELDLGPIGKYNTKFDFKHVETKGDKDKIDITAKLEYTPPTKEKMAGLPFIIHSADLKTESGTGHAIFDRAKGRFESTEITMRIKGTLKIEVGNMKTDVTLEQTQTAKSKTSDDADASWKLSK
jgi:hypothetical protein